MQHLAEEALSKWKRLVCRVASQMSPLLSDGLSLQMKAKGTLQDYLFSHKALSLVSSPLDTQGWNTQRAGLGPEALG